MTFTSDASLRTVVDHFHAALGGDDDFEFTAFEDDAAGSSITRFDYVDDVHGGLTGLLFVTQVSLDSGSAYHVQLTTLVVARTP